MSCALLCLGAFLCYSIGSFRQTEVYSTLEKNALRKEIKELQSDVEALKLLKQSVEEKNLGEEIDLPPRKLQTDGEAATVKEEKERRSKLISSALTAGYVEQYYPEDGFISIHVQDKNLIKEGSRLVIRRRGLIVGQVLVTTIEGAEAIADVLDYTFAEKPILINQRDELISLLF